MADFKFRKGDRVRVVAPEDTFGDYDVGSEAVIRGIDGDGAGVTVDWAEPFHGDVHCDAARVYYLFARELELIA